MFTIHSRRLRINSQRRNTRRIAVAITGALVVGCLGVGVPSQASPGPAGDPGKSPAWLDSGRSISDRVNALLAVMTLPEKVGQMDQQLVTTLTDPDGNTCGNNGFNLPNPQCMQKILVDANTGSILAGGTENPGDTTGAGGVGNTGLDWANQYNIIQQYAIKNSRLHIPVIFGVDAVHGFRAPVAGAVVPTIDRDRRDLGRLGRQVRRRSHRQGGASHRLELGIRARPGSGQGQSLGSDV